MIDNDEPSEGSVWRHRNGNLYAVLFLTNQDDRPDTYPRTVVYQGADGRRWSRPLSGWSRSMSEGDLNDRVDFVAEQTGLLRTAALAVTPARLPDVAVTDEPVRPPSRDFTGADLDKAFGVVLRTEAEWAERRTRVALTGLAKP